MLIVHVFIEVKPEFRDEFIDETKANAKASIKEPGIARFDFLQDIGKPNAFLLVEVYRTEADPAKHKETKHYQKWNEAVKDMMAVPRSKKIYKNILPGEEEWDSN